MHPNFYHWHARAELKPETAILEPRWKAAAGFAKTPSAADILSLLQLVLFPGAEPAFAKRFTEALVKGEPTFPIDKNAELLRAMAAASVYSQLEKPSNAATAIALGLQAANFPNGRIEPVCQDVITRASEYLVVESERVRPRIYVGPLAKAQRQAETHFDALQKAVEANVPQEIGKSTEALGRGVLSVIKESHQQLGEVIGRLTEESQFLWWLVGRRSPALNTRRELCTPEAYALPVATEVAERVALLPPPASVESLINEALSQCSKGRRSNMSLADLMATDDGVWAQRTNSTPAAPELTPIAAILALRRAAGKLDTNFWKKLRISSKMKVAPAEAARQYFRELMFLRAMKEMS